MRSSIRTFLLLIDQKKKKRAVVLFITSCPYSKYLQIFIVKGTIKYHESMSNWAANEAEGPTT